MWRCTPDKQDAVYNYQGQRLTAAYRVLAEGGVSLAADLMKADEDPAGRGATVGSGDRATPAGVAKIRCRWDAGYFAADLAKHCIDRAWSSRSGETQQRVVRACREAPTAGWHPAKTCRTPRSRSSTTCPDVAAGPRGVYRAATRIPSS